MSPEAAAPPAWAASGDWRTAWPAPADVIAGESHYQDALLALAGPPRPGGWLVPVDVELVREHGNEHDANAIRAEIGGAKVGYLRRALAAEAAPRLDADGVERLTFAGLVRGGSGHAATLGVHLFLDAPGTPATLPVPPALLADAAVPWPPSSDEGAGPGGGLLRYGTDYVAPHRDVLDRHLAYQDVIDHAYALRGSGQGALAVAVAASQRQVALAAEAAAAFRARADEPLPEHRGYTVLATVREQQGSFDEALRLCQEASAAGWAGDWDGRAERLRQRLARRAAR